MAVQLKRHAPVEDSQWPSTTMSSVGFACITGSDLAGGSHVTEFSVLQVLSIRTEFILRSFTHPLDGAAVIAQSKTDAQYSLIG